MSWPGEASTAALEVEVVHVLVERSAGVLEPHLDDVRGYVLRILFEPRGFVEFEASVAGLGLDLLAAVAEGASAADFGFEIPVMLVVFGIHDGIICVKIGKKFQFTA